MTTRSNQLLTLRRQEQDSHGYSSSSRWYIFLSNAISYLALAETATSSLDQFRNAWATIYNLFMMDHQAGEPENMALSRWVGAVGPDPRIQLQAEQLPTALLQAMDSAKQNVLWDAERRKWRDAKQQVEIWLYARQRSQQLGSSKTCSYAFIIGRDLRNALSHPALNPGKAGIRRVFDLAAPFYVDLAEAAIRAAIEHPQPGVTGRMIAYRFFLYPYVKNSDSFLSDYYLERLLPQDELETFPEAEAKDALKVVARELDARHPRLLPATDVATTAAEWCQPVLFPALGLDVQPGATIVSQEGVFQPTFVLPVNGAAVQAEYQGKAAGQDLACLLWVVPWRASLDAAAGDGTFAGLSTMEVAQLALLQSDVPWAILTNGHRLRLLHKASAHRPRAFLEVDLNTVAARRDQVQARQAFRYLQCFFSGSSFLERDAQDRTRLERILAESERHGKEIGQELKQNVFKALEELGDGFLYLMGQEPARVQQWQQQTSSSLSVADYLLSDELFKTIYEESLALMYRLLFLFYAESRDLLPMHDELYRDTYSLEALRDDIISVHDDPDPRRFYSAGSASLDERLRELFRLVNEGLGTLIPAYNGGLFDPEKHPFLEHFRVGDYYLARAIDLLSRTRPKTNNVGGGGRKKVTYRDLDVRHLGEIYEGLLEYSAHIAPEQQVIFERTKGGSKYEEYVAASQLSAAERRQVEQYRQAYAEDPDLPRLPAGCKVTGIKEKGQYFLVYGGKESKRRSTGSYYTPDYIVQYIVENTLGPLVRGENREGALKDRPLSADEILELKVLDPAMGSGHFLVAATEYLARAYGQALIREGRDRDGAMDDKEFIRYKRLVAERCIYGVDINLLAVELAKLSMWLFTMDAQRPLSFLDHHLKCGNSLVGAWVKDLGTRPGVKPHPLQPNLFEHHFIARVPVMVGHVLEIMTRETLTHEDIAAKKALDEAIDQLKQPFRNLADLWIDGVLGERLVDYESLLMDAESAREVESARADTFRFFHWELEFPEVWFDETGNRKLHHGFGAIIGNPPYDVLEKDRGGSTRPHAVSSSFVRMMPEYEPALGGKLNLFRLFLIRSMSLLARGYRIGLIIPLALLADISCAPTRRYLIKHSQGLIAECFPQKDDPNRRVFIAAKLSTVIVVGTRTDEATDKDSYITVRIFPWNSFGDQPLENSLSLSDAGMLDPENTPIPLLDRKSWAVCKKVHEHPDVRRFGEIDSIHVNRGEINQTIYRNYIVSDSSHARLIKGAEIGFFRVRSTMSQGVQEWFDEAAYVKQNLPNAKADLRRIATQRITGVDERYRIIAAIVDPRAYFADSTNSVIVEESPSQNLEYVTALLNSNVSQWRFKLTSTNNNVGTNEIESLPYRQIDIANQSERDAFDEIVGLTRVLTETRNGQASKNRPASSRVDVQATISRINELVYQLYDLTRDEIAVIESSLS